MSTDLKSLQHFMQRCARMGVRHVSIPNVISFELWAPVSSVEPRLGAPSAQVVQGAQTPPDHKPPPPAQPTPVEAYIQQQYGVDPDTFLYSVS